MRLNKKRWEALAPEVQNLILTRYNEHCRACRLNHVTPMSKADFIDDYLLDPLPMEIQGYNPEPEPFHYRYDVYISPPTKIA